jgi:hypothetical protein
LCAALQLATLCRGDSTPAPRAHHAKPHERRQTINIHIYYYSQLLLAPLLIIGVTGLARASQKRVILAMAATAMLVLVVGVVYYDVVTGFRSLNGYVFTHRSGIASTIPTVESSFVVIAAGNALVSGAAILALSQAARLSRWGWFAALAITMLVGQAVMLAFSTGFPLADIRPDLYTLYIEGDAQFSVGLFSILSVLIVLNPMVSLLYGLRSPHEPAATAPVTVANPTPQPPSATA